MVYVNGVRFGNSIEAKYAISRLSGEKFLLAENSVPLRGALMFRGVRVTVEGKERFLKLFGKAEKLGATA